MKASTFDLYGSVGNVGNVSIGTTSPGSVRLVAMAANSVAYFNATDPTATNIMELRFSGINNPDASREYITFVDDDTEMGRIEGTGAGGVTYASGAGDFAEWMRKLDPAEPMEEGDVVAVKKGRITKNTDAADSLLVVSQSPALLGKTPSDKTEVPFGEKVALVGQVPLKVRGRVHHGDYILASGLNDGFGIARPKSDVTFDEFKTRVIGIAWESSDSEEERRINVAVGVK